MIVVKFKAPVTSRFPTHINYGLLICIKFSCLHVSQQCTLMYLILCGWN